jgi:hypothetical protein
MPVKSFMTMFHNQSAGVPVQAKKEIYIFLLRSLCLFALRSHIFFG